MKQLDDKLCVRSKKLNSRIVLPAMAINAAKNGIVTDDLLEYYQSIICHQSCGMVITEHMYISEEGKGSPNNISLSKDTDIKNVKKISDLCHKFNTVCIAQINHCGGKAVSDLKTVAPNDIIPPSRRRKISEIPQSLELNEVQAIIGKFIKSAVRAKNAGFDGIELHAAHGYLLNEFYSPLTNMRNDIYGGSLPNRCRIIREIIYEIRKKCGDDFIIAIKLGVSDFDKDGITIQDTINLLDELDIKSIDIVELSGGLCGTNIPDKTKKILFLDELKSIKNNPTVNDKFLYCLTGGITEYFEAKDIITNDNCDLIGVGRATLANRDWAFDAINYVRGKVGEKDENQCRYSFASK